jgi:hypothetical protein
MGQNYLRADLYGPEPGTVPISGRHGLHICYDGQMGESFIWSCFFGTAPGCCKS